MKKTILFPALVCVAVLFSGQTKTISAHVELENSNNYLIFWFFLSATVLAGLLYSFFQKKKKERKRKEKIAAIRLKRKIQEEEEGPRIFKEDDLIQFIDSDVQAEHEKNNPAPFRVSKSEMKDIHNKGLPEYLWDEVVSIKDANGFVFLEGVDPFELKKVK